MKKIVVISLETINNIGDDLLGFNTRHLVRTIEKDVEVIKVELVPNKKILLKNKWFIRLFFSKLLYILSKYICSNFFKNISYKIKCNKYFRKMFFNTNAIILAIGMLKYSTQDFSYVFYLINKIAKEYNIPVFMSAMSIENINLADWRCRQLIEAVNFSSVKMITTRDTEKELDVLRNNYLKNNLSCETAVVGDPALWTSEFIKMKEKNNNKIGIGLIRTGIYKDYGNKNIDDKYIFGLYKDIIEELEKRKIEWSLFCNGMREDYEVGVALLKELNLDESKLMFRPKTINELVDILSNFKVVLGARLHCCITSYTYNIPIVGLIWDNKLRSFAKKIDWYDNFIEKENLNAKYIVDKLVEVEKKQYSRDLFYKLRESNLKSFKDFLNREKNN